MRLADALIVSETRHKTIASLSRVIVEAPDPSNGAESRRMSPWTADDLRAPLRHFIVTDVVAYAQEADERTLSGSLDDSLGAKAKGTRHLEAVDSHHDHTKSQGKKPPASTNGAVHVEVRLALGARSSAYDWRLSLREKTVRRLKKHRVPAQRLRLRKKTMLAQAMLTEFQPLLPPDWQVSVLCDRW